jgi:endoglucanase
MKRRVLVAGLITHLLLAGGGVTVLATDVSLRRTAPATTRTAAAPSSQPTQPEPSAPPGACRVVFKQRDRWRTGFTADVILTNEGPGIDGWVLTYTAAPGVRVVQGWNGVWSQQGSQVTVRNANWNATLETGDTVTAGLSAAFDRPNGPPTTFIFNGTTCH